MKNLKITLCLTSLAIAGCVSAPPAPPAIAFNYKTQNAGGVGIVQVFEMNGNTVVQIKDLQDKAPLFVSDGNVEIKYQVIGQTAVLPGIQKSFNVVNSGNWAHVTRMADITAPTAPATAPASVSAPVTSQIASLTPDDLRAQIESMKQEIQRLKGFIKASGTDGTQDEPSMPVASRQTGSAPTPNYAPIKSAKDVTSISVSFKNNSADFDPRASVANTILNLARDASEIAITGYTDGVSPSAANTQLAKGRAIAARKFLISNGVDKSKIAVSYLPSGGFVADNTTKEGRDKNRRVEIEIL